MENLTHIFSAGYSLKIAALRGDRSAEAKLTAKISVITDRRSAERGAFARGMEKAVADFGGCLVL